MAITEQDRAKAFAMFEAGESTSGVAKKLFKRYWLPAKKLRDEWEAARGGAEGAAEPKAVEPKRRKKRQAEEPEAEPETPDAWELVLSLPTERMDQIFAGFTAQQKADAISSVLQTQLAEG